MRQTWLGLISTSLTFLLAVPAPAQLKGRVWTHEPLGIQVTIPDGYSVVPLQIDEKWILAKFLSDKAYLSKNRDWNREHHPLMRVIAFTEAAKKSAGVEVQEEKDGSTFIGIGAVPYQGYRDYVKRHRSGFFFSKEDEAKVGGQDCLMCEVQINKDEPKLHLYSVVFRRPTFEVAVEFEVLEDRLDKLERSCMDALESVRFTAPAATAGVTHGDGAKPAETKKMSNRLWTGFRSEWRKRPSLERSEIRHKIEQEHHAAVREKTPPDWTVTDTKHFLVVSHADERFTARMVEGGEAFFEWCEKEFSTLGDDYVRRPVMRLCRDFDEYKAYHFDSSNSTGWSLFDDDHEIGTYRDEYNGTSGKDVSNLFTGILIHYLQEMDPYIVNYSPYWLTWALDDYVSSSLVKNRKIEFRVDDWVRDESRDMQREGKLPGLHKILELDADGFTSMMKVERRTGYATTQALRYVLGPGQKEKVFKDFLRTYFKAVISAAERHADQWDAKPGKSAETEEEEEQQAKERADKSKERRKQLQKEINDVVFDKIGDKQWEKLDKGFDTFVKAGK
ncbi:MAG TPA: hypothetical protein VFZ65_12250 [Planctomycetota bacterium]|nr:hypothetical protein [Planctomycetota bacterium]